MTRTTKSFFLSLLLLIAFSVPSFCISDRITRIQSIPGDAQPMASGHGWTVYARYTEKNSFPPACVLYLENAETRQTYLLLKTAGTLQRGTPVSIKARNAMAYGSGNHEDKKTASYETGFICGIDTVCVLSPKKLLISGVPDAVNYYSYVFDLDTFSAVHIEAYNPFIRTVSAGGRQYLEFSTPYYAPYRSGYRLEWYDLDGNLVRKMAPVLEE